MVSATPSTSRAAAEVVRRASEQLFANRLLTNIHRAVVVEAIVAMALEPDWTWCAADYSSFDFKHDSGIRLEVKQSASLQSWNETKLKESRCSFDIAKRKGEWVNGVEWVEREGRNADIYVFCHHPLVSIEADHREPAQWHFYVISAERLPDRKRIGLSAIQALSNAVGHNGLRQAVAAGGRAR